MSISSASCLYSHKGGIKKCLSSFKVANNDSDQNRNRKLRYIKMDQNYLRNLTVFILIALPILGAIISCSYAVNIPMLDDYGFVLDFLDHFRNATTFEDKLKVVLAPRSNYLFVTFNMLVLIDYWIFSKISFIHLIYASNILHLLIILNIYRIFRRQEVSMKFFIPVILLLSVPNFSILNWACYVAHVMGVLFSLLTIWYLSQKTPRSFWFGLLSAVLASFSAPGGFLAFLVVIPILLDRSDRRPLMIWIFTFILTLFIYILLILPLGEEIQGAVTGERRPLTYLLNVVLFFGSVFKGVYREYHIWGAIFGLIICGILAWIALARFPTLKKNPVILAGLLLGILLAIVVTLMRSRYGLGATTAYRYRLYQLVSLVFIYLFMSIDQKILVQKYLSVIIILSLFVYGFRLQYNLDLLREKVWQLKAGIHHFQMTGYSDQLSFRAPEQGAELLNRLAAQGIYDAYALNVSEEPRLNLPKRNPLQMMKYDVEKIDDLESYFEISGWAFPAFSSGQSLEIYLVIRSGETTYYYRTGPLLNKEVLAEKSEAGFIGIIDKRTLPYDWNAVKIGLALRHPYQGIIAEHFLP